MRGKAHFDGATDGRTDEACYRVACPQSKSEKDEPYELDFKVVQVGERTSDHNEGRNQVGIFKRKAVHKFTFESRAIGIAEW